MKPVPLHVPGVALTDEPPAPLIRASDTLQSPLVSRTGITTTKDGRWALYVTVPSTASIPIADVESQSGGFPVVYEAEPSSPPLAAPAFPPRARRR